MKRKIAFFAVLLCLAAASPAMSLYVSTEELARRCLGNRSEDISACTSYIAGVIDYHLLLQSLGTAPTIDFCLPENLSLAQASVRVMGYLQDAPQHDAFIAASAVPLALNKAFPCAPRKKGRK